MSKQKAGKIFPAFVSVISTKEISLLCQVLLAPVLAINITVLSFRDASYLGMTILTAYKLSKPISI